MRASASSPVMIWPLRSLNKTVFWPTGHASLNVGTALVVGDRRLRVLAGGSLGAARLGVEHVLYPAR
jgi:hypothetical protein